MKDLEQKAAQLRQELNQNPSANLSADEFRQNIAQIQQWHEQTTAQIQQDHKQRIAQIQQDYDQQNRAAEVSPNVIQLGLAEVDRDPFSDVTFRLQEDSGDRSSSADSFQGVSGLGDADNSSSVRAFSTHGSEDASTDPFADDAYPQTKSSSDHIYTIKTRPSDVIRDNQETSSQGDNSQYWFEKAKSALRGGFYTEDDISGGKKDDFQKSGKDLKAEEVRNNYYKGIKDIDENWEVVRLLSREEGGLTHAGEIVSQYLRNQVETSDVLHMTHMKQRDPDRDRKTRYRAILSENTSNFQKFAKLLSDAPIPSSDTNTPGLREQLESVKSGTLGDRLKGARNFIKSNWERIPDNGSWHGENKEKLHQDLTAIQEYARKLRNRKDTFLTTDEGGKLTLSKEQKEMLRSDVYKAVLFLEAVAQQIREDFNVEG